MAHRSIVWEDYEYAPREKTADWYWTVWIVAISISAIAVIYGNILFAGVVLIGTFALSIYASRVPARIRYEITEKGVVIGNTMYPFVTLEGFGFDTYMPGNPKLILKSKKRLMSYIILPLRALGEGGEDEVRKFMRYYLREGEHEEPLAQTIMEYLGF